MTNGTQSPPFETVWENAKETDFRDAYLSWSAVLRNRAPDRELSSDPELEPIFVRLTDASAAGRKALQAELDKPRTRLWMDAHERAFLDARAGAQDPFAGLDDCYALYRRVKTGDSVHLSLFAVIDTGEPVRLLQKTVPQPPVDLPPSGTPGKPIIAVIDDAIAFLNDRFCKAGKTRLHGFWLQGLEHGTGAVGGVAAGAVLSADTINALLDIGDEDAAYAQAYRQYLSANAVSGLHRSVWHGTHVLDLAAGSDAGDEAEDWPLLAVQLPPEAIEDTTGMRVESYLVQGLRWILRSARQIDQTAPIIVNLSLGVLAGPKDGTQFVEWCLRREAAQWQRATGQTVRIVWAYGNSYRGALVAGVDYGAVTFRSDNDAERRLTWRVQPDDLSPNFCELRGHGISSTQFDVSLSAPDSAPSGFATIAPGQSRSLMRQGVAVACIFHVPERELEPGVISPSHYVVALANSAAHDMEAALAAAGAWQIALRYTGPDAAYVSMQIQRDEALRGAGGQARQSYFDDPSAYAWDEVWQDYGGLAEDGPIRHEGTHSAFASYQGDEVLTVGAAQRSSRVAAESMLNTIPSDYSGQGADWSLSQKPTVSAIVDGGPFHAGVLGAGRYSGAVRFTNGTSAAAARITRALAQSVSAGAKIPNLKASGVRKLPVDPVDASRLGSFAIEMEQEKAARR